MNTPDRNDEIAAATNTDQFLKWCALRERLIERLGAPSLGVPWCPDWLAWLFACDLQTATDDMAVVIETLSKVDKHERWSPDILVQGLEQTCRDLDLPANVRLHQQPMDLLLLFGVPLGGQSLHEYLNDPFDIRRPLEILTPELYLHFLRWLARKAAECRRLGISEGKCMQWIAPELKMVGMRLLAFTCTEGLAGRLEAVMAGSDYLKFTSGCFDSTSGALTDEGREVAALREFNMNGGRHD